MYDPNMPLADGSPMAARIVLSLECIGMSEVCLDRHVRLVGGTGVFVDDANYQCLPQRDGSGARAKAILRGALYDSRRRLHLGHR